MPIRPCKSTTQTAVEACELLSEPHKNNRTRIDGKVQAEGQTKGKRKDRPKESEREKRSSALSASGECVCAQTRCYPPFPTLARVPRARIPQWLCIFAVTSVTRGQERDWKRPKKIDEFRAHNEQNKGCDSIYPSKQARQQTHRTEFQQLIPICDRCDSKKAQNSCTYAYAYARERERG